MILVRVSSKVCATSSAAPPQPRPADCPAGQDPEASLSRSKSSQQRSDQARKPVNSEQDSCSWTAPGPGSLISDALDARQAHNLKVIGSNPIPATTFVITHSPSRPNRRDGLTFSGERGDSPVDDDSQVFDFVMPVERIELPTFGLQNHSSMAACECS